MTKKPMATIARGNVQRKVRATLGARVALSTPIPGPETIGPEVYVQPPVARGWTRQSTRLSTPGLKPQHRGYQTLRSMTATEYMLNLGLIGLVVVQIRGHKITRARLLFPVVVTAWVAAQFLHGLPTAGNDTVLEGTLAFSGAALGVLAGLATNVKRQGEGAFAKAGALAAVLWIAGIGARVAFSVWVAHGGQASVASFSASHHITSGAAWAAGFIFMAMVEVTVRTAVLYFKTLRSGAEIPRGGLRHRLATA